jgi:hypothetical protein
MDADSDCPSLLPDICDIDVDPAEAGSIGKQQPRPPVRSITTGRNLPVGLH